MQMRTKITGTINTIIWKLEKKSSEVTNISLANILLMMTSRCITQDYVHSIVIWPPPAVKRILSYLTVETHTKIIKHPLHDYLKKWAIDPHSLEKPEAFDQEES